MLVSKGMLIHSLLRLLDQRCHRDLLAETACHRRSALDGCQIVADVTEILLPPSVRLGWSDSMKYGMSIS